MATASVKLTLDNAEFMAKMAAANAALSEFGAKMRGIVLGAAGAIGAIVGVYGAAQLMGKALNEAADMEKLETAFATLIGNSKVARETLAELQEFADTTPFTMGDVAPAAKQLMAYGFAAKDTVGTLRMLGDVASALNIPLGEITEVFGRNVAAGRVFTKDINEFQGRGIPIVAQLAKQFNVSEQAIRKMVEEGKIGSAELIRAFQAMTGPGSQFGGMMAEQSKTFAGMLSSLKDRFDAAFREFGKPLIGALKPIIDWVQSNMGAIVAKAKEWGESLANGIRVAFGVIRDGRIGEVISLSLEAGSALGFDAFLRHGQAAIKTVMVMMGAIAKGFTAANGPFSYLGESEFWLGIAAMASAAFIKVANGFGNALNDASGDVFGDLADKAQADFAMLAQVGYGGTKTHKEFEAEFKADRNRDRTAHSAELDKAIADAAASQKEYIKRAAAGVPEALRLATAAYADALAAADGSPEVKRQGEAALEKLRELFAGINDAGKKTEDAMKAKEKTGAPFAGKDLLAATKSMTGAGKFDVIASSLAKVGGGGLFASALPTDPLIAATKNATQATDRNTAAVIENNRLLSQPRTGERFSLTHR